MIERIRVGRLAGVAPEAVGDMDEDRFGEYADLLVVIDLINVARAKRQLPPIRL